MLAPDVSQFRLETLLDKIAKLTFCYSRQMSSMSVGLTSVLMILYIIYEPLNQSKGSLGLILWKQSK